MDDLEKDVKVKAALDAAELASKFMKSQMSAFSLLNFGRPPIEINWSAYYHFAAGVYDYVSQAFEERYQYDLHLTIAALPAFVGNDLTAASKVHSALKTPNHHNMTGGTECQKCLNHEEFDKFALARSFGLIN